MGQPFYSHARCWASTSPQQFGRGKEPAAEKKDSSTSLGPMFKQTTKYMFGHVECRISMWGTPMLRHSHKINYPLLSQAWCQEFGAQMPLRRGQALLARFGACNDGKPGYLRVCLLNLLSSGQVAVDD